jgi:hypothetical protein
LQPPQTPLPQPLQPSEQEATPHAASAAHPQSVVQPGSAAQPQFALPAFKLAAVVS